MTDSSRPKRLPSLRTILAMLIAGFIGYLISEFRRTPRAESSRPEHLVNVRTADIFPSQLFKFLDQANKLKAMGSQGVSHDEFSSQLVNVKAAYDSLLVAWPPNLSAGAGEEFEQAISGWDLALKLWRLKIRDSELTSSRNEPAEPDINGYAVFVAYGQKALAFEKYSEDLGHMHLRGKTYLPFDRNIRALCALAEGHLEIGAKTFSPAR